MDTAVRFAEQSRFGPDMTVARAYDASVRLANGKVLVAGGTPSNRSSEIYDPATDQFAATGSMVNPHGNGHALFLLSNGKALLVDAPNNTFEIYDAATGLWSPLTPIANTDPLVITSTSSWPGTSRKPIRRPYKHRVERPYSWSVSTGTLPAGLSISTGGVIAACRARLDHQTSRRKFRMVLGISRRRFFQSS